MKEVNILGLDQSFSDEVV